MHFLFSVESYFAKVLFVFAADGLYQVVRSTTVDLSFLVPKICEEEEEQKEEKEEDKEEEEQHQLWQQLQM